MKRFVFMISDGTGITVESLGHSLMSQFEGIESLPKRVQVMPADVATVKSYIATHCD